MRPTKVNDSSAGGAKGATFTCLEENRRRFPSELKEMFGIGVFLVDSGENGNVRLTIFQLGDGPSRSVGICWFIGVLQRQEYVSSSFWLNEEAERKKGRKSILQFPCNMAVGLCQLL